MKILLETPRLVLRQFTNKDINNLVSLDSDPHVMRFINGGIASSYEEINHTFLPDVLSYYQEYENLGFWAIIQKSNQEFIGWIVLRPESRFRLAKILNVAETNALELGYRLRQKSWSKGYATEAALELIDRVLITQQFTKIIAWALAENQASIRVMEKLGLKFKQEYILTAADVLPNIELLKSPVIQHILNRKLVKYERKLNKQFINNEKE